VGAPEYGSYSSRLRKRLTKVFFPQTHEAVKQLAAMSYAEEVKGVDTPESERKGEAVVLGSQL
jgi:hypothetical protein